MRHWFEQLPIAAPSVQARRATANALKRRGSLTIWFDPARTWEAAPTGKRGRQPDYSGEEDQKTVRGTVFPTNAIQTCLTLKVLFGMALRQTTGFVESLLRLIDLDWPVPNFSTPSRRQRTLKVNIPYRGSQGPLHLLIDSTGIKVEGEGEWNARKHGGTKRRVWRKIHSGIDEKTLEIRAAELTTGDVGDVAPASATGSSEPTRDATRASRPDPARSGNRQRHCRRCLRHPPVP